MKNLIMGAIALSIFVFALSVLQMSCSKSEAQTGNNALNQLDKIIYSKELPTGGAELWTSNYDGTNQIQIPVSLPANYYITSNSRDHYVRLSPDGQTVFFQAKDNTAPASQQSSICACNIDGSNFRIVIQGANDLIRLGGAY